MAGFLRLWSGVAASAGVVIVQPGVVTGYERMTPGVMEGVLGQVSLDPIMSQSIDQSPRKSGQREGSRTFKERWEVVGSSWSDYVAKRDALIAEIRDANMSNGAARLRVRSEQGSFAVEYEVQHINTGPLTSHAAELTNRHIIDLEFVCSPYALGDPMDVTDVFDANTLGTAGLYNNGGADWTVRSGATPTIATSRMTLAANASPCVIEHTGTPYQIGDCQQIVEFRFSAQVSGTSVGAVLKRLPDGSQLVVLARDNGINGLTSIAKVSSGGSVTILASSVGAARFTANTSYFLRARIDGNAIVADVYSSFPARLSTLSGISNMSSVHVLAGGDATAFGDGVAGASAIQLNVTATSAVSVGHWERTAYTYINRSMASVQTTGAIPGTAKAAVSVVGYATTGSIPPWLSLGWMPRRTAATYTRPFGLVDTTTGLSSLTNTADASAYGSTVAVTSAASASCTIGLDPSAILADKGSGDRCLVRIVARVRLASGSTAATIKATVNGSPPIEYSSARSLAAFRSSTVTAYRLVSLGTFSLSTISDPTVTVPLVISITDAGSGTVGLDHIQFMPALRTAQSMSSIPSTALVSGATFIRVDSNGRGQLLQQSILGTYNVLADSPSLFGSRFLVDHGEHLEWSLLGSTMPLDQTDGATAASQTAGSGCSYQLSVQPRYWIGS